MSTLTQVGQEISCNILGNVYVHVNLGRQFEMPGPGLWITLRLCKLGTPETYVFLVLVPCIEQLCMLIWVGSQGDVSNILRANMV
jgi:hypothetical protein